MTLKSIDTKYAGCLFRSRLEARWAVALDRLDIAWEYEPQGYEVTNRLRYDDVPDTFRYLPDFWLPSLGVWLEVKGELDDTKRRRLLSAAASLSSNDGGGCHDFGGHDLAVAGHVTTPNAVGIPVLLHMHKGDLTADCLLCGPHIRDIVVATDAGEERPHDLLRGFYCTTHSADPAVIAAFDAARTARFEHGAKPKAARR